jgi:hypothetical protein
MDMKTKNSAFWAVAITAVVVLSVPAIAQMQGQQDMSAQEMKMMEQMMKYGTPGPAHEFLKKYAGDWDVEISSWPGPGAPAQMSKGTMTNRLIFDGRYVKCDFEGEMGGMAYKGFEIIGYDLFKKVYTTFWIDSMSTALLMTSGTLDKAGNVLTETGSSPDPMTDGKTMQKFRNVTTFMGDGKYKFEMFMVMPDGKEFKSMELSLTRKI